MVVANSVFKVVGKLSLRQQRSYSMMHMCFLCEARAFTLQVEKEKLPDDYDHLTNTFRNDFRELAGSAHMTTLSMGKTMV